MATHGILPRDVEGCPPASEFTLPAVDYVIGHNIDFDMTVIGNPSGPKRICTLALCRKYWPDIDSHTQMAMLYCFDPEYAQANRMLAHGAGSDVKMCRVVLDYIVAATSVKTWEELWQRSEIARVPEKFTFGKHKGMRIADAPADYKAWMLRQPDVDPYLAKALRA
jgi:exodeoxyribonuclease X